jgi:hypothetical protein
MNEPNFEVDFNELLEPDLVLLSKNDQRNDASGTSISLREGMQVTLFMEDEDEEGNRDDLVARGTVERNKGGNWASHVTWLCRIDAHGIRSASEAAG